MVRGVITSRVRDRRGHCAQIEKPRLRLRGNSGGTPEAGILTFSPKKIVGVRGQRTVPFLTYVLEWHLHGFVCPQKRESQAVRLT